MEVQGRGSEANDHVEGTNFRQVRTMSHLVHWRLYEMGGLFKSGRRLAKRD
jgi:hypothetical protein